MNTPKVRIYVTEYTKADGHRYGSTVAARSFDEAQSDCDCRGIGEKVLGELGAVVERTPDGPMTHRGTTDDEPPTMPGVDLPDPDEDGLR